MTQNNDVSEFLEHYGVKGMQWGVRKDRITSAISSRQTQIKENKAATLEARAAKANIRIKELNDEIAAIPKGSKLNDFKREDLTYEISANKSQRNEDLKNAEKIRGSRFTPTQKKVLIGTAVVGGLIAAGYLANRYDPEGIGASVRVAMSQKKYGDVFKTNPELSGPMSASDILNKVSKPVNPNFKDLGGQMNCRRSTFAHELRRRGYDVHATTSALGYGQSETGLTNALIKGDKNIINSASLSSMVVNKGSSRARPVSKDTREYKAFTQATNDINKLGDLLKKQPNGARGEIVFEMLGFGHSMAYENINGVPYIFDSQKGQMYKATAQDLNNLTKKWGRPSGMAITRLDNIDLDMEFVARWAKNY